MQHAAVLAQNHSGNADRHHAALVGHRYPSHAANQILEGIAPNHLWIQMCTLIQEMQIKMALVDQREGTDAICRTGEAQARLLLKRWPQGIAQAIVLGSGRCWLREG